MCVKTRYINSTRGTSSGVWGCGLYVPCTSAQGTGYINSTRCTSSGFYVPCISAQASESYRRWLRSLLLYCTVPVLVLLVLLTSLNCCMSTLRLVHYAFLLTPAYWKSNNTNAQTYGFRTFSCFGPHIWNSLPQDLRHCSTLSSFKAKLKTFLFSQYFHPN